MWQIGSLDPDAVWAGEWGRSRMGVLNEGGDCRREGPVLEMNLGCPIVTNGDGDALFPNYLAEDLFTLRSSVLWPR